MTTDQTTEDEAVTTTGPEVTTTTNPTRTTTHVSAVEDGITTGLTTTKTTTTKTTGTTTVISETTETAGGGNTPLRGAAAENDPRQQYGTGGPSQGSGGEGAGHVTVQ